MNISFRHMTNELHLADAHLEGGGWGMAGASWIIGYPVFQFLSSYESFPVLCELRNPNREDS
jgi:hypothetical protein